MSRLSNSRQQKMRAPVKSVSYNMSKALSLLTKRPGGALTFGYLRLCLLLDHTCIGVSWHRTRDSGSSHPGCTVNATNMNTKGVGRPCWYEMAFSQRKIGLPNKADVLTGDLLVHTLPCGAAIFFFPPTSFFLSGFRLCFQYSDQRSSMVGYTPIISSATLQDAYAFPFIVESICKEMLQDRCSSQPEFKSTVFKGVYFHNFYWSPSFGQTVDNRSSYWGVPTPGSCSPPATPGRSLISPTMHIMPTQPESHGFKAWCLLLLLSPRSNMEHEALRTSQALHGPYRLR